MGKKDTVRVSFDVPVKDWKKFLERLESFNYHENKRCRMEAQEILNIAIRDDQFLEDCFNY